MGQREPNDLLFGIPAIAAHLGIKRRQAEYQIARGAIPTFKMGRTVCALRSEIDAHLRQQVFAAKQQSAAQAHEAKNEREREAAALAAQYRPPGGC